MILLTCTNWTTQIDAFVHDGRDTLQFRAWWSIAADFSVVANALLTRQRPCRKDWFIPPGVVKLLTNVMRMRGAHTAQVTGQFVLFHFIPHFRVCLLLALAKSLLLFYYDEIPLSLKNGLNMYTVLPLNMVIWYKLQPDIWDKKMRSWNFLGSCNIKDTCYESLGFKGQPDIKTWFLGPDELSHRI